MAQRVPGRVPDFMTTSQDDGKIVSLMHRPPLPPGNSKGLRMEYAQSNTTIF